LYGLGGFRDMAAVSKLRGVRLPVEMDAALVAWAEGEGVSVSEALRVAVERLVAAGPAGRPVAARRVTGGSSSRGSASRAELFAGLRVPVSVRGRRSGEASE
jgi:hypothetical protein